MREFRHSGNVHKYKAKQGNEDAHRSLRDLSHDTLLLFNPEGQEIFIIQSNWWQASRCDLGLFPQADYRD